MGTGDVETGDVKTWTDGELTSIGDRRRGDRDRGQAGFSGR